MMTSLAILAALALDAVLPDPERSWHPVRLFGGMAGTFQQLFIKSGCTSRPAGFCFTALCLLTGGLIAFASRRLASVHPAPLFAFDVILIYFSISARQLADEAASVRLALEAQELTAARARLARICGRDTNQLGPEEVARGAVESLSENTVDGVTAPLLFAAIFGPLGAWVYRMANTLDSMVGYRHGIFETFGWASARLDDALNYIPARLTAALMSLNAPIVNGSPVRAWSAAWTESSRHDSPNAGWPEACSAAALNVSLGGPAIYAGERVEKPYFCESGRAPGSADIGRMTRLMALTVAEFGLVMALMSWLIT